MTIVKSVTVAVCSRNRGRALQRAVESILGSDAVAGIDASIAVDVLVVDNGSTDDTAERMHRLAARDARVRYVHEPVAGISVARNRALHEAQSDIVIFVDDDETVCPGFVAAHLDVYTTQPTCSAVGGAMDLYFDDGEPRWVSPALMGLYSSYPVVEGALHRVATDELLPFGGNLSLRIADANACGGFSTTLGRVGKSLISGEETALLEAMRASGFEIWVTGAARIRHHIPTERARVMWVLRRSFAQGRTEQRIAGGAEWSGAVLHLFFGGLRLLLKRKSVNSRVFVEYLVHRVYWAGRLTEIVHSRRTH